MYLIYKHLLKTTVGPFFFGFFVITFVLMIEVLFRYIDLFVSKGIPFLMATEVLALSLGHTFALSIPMAVLVAVLMGVGQLASDHEITALKASGIGLFAVLRPLLIGAGFITLALTAYNHFVFPESNHRLANLLFDIYRKKPMIDIREQVFTEMNDQTTIHVRKKDDRTGRIMGVTIIQKNEPGDTAPRLTTAEWGRIIPKHENNALLIELHNGETHEFPEAEDPTKYQIIRFTQQDILLPDMEQDFQESDRTARGDREMNLTALRAAADQEAQHQEEIVTRTAQLPLELMAQQWKLLDPQERLPLIGRADGFQGPHDEAFRRSKLLATRQNVMMTANKASYQEKIRRNYRAKENRFRVEFHKKFAIPFACLVFVLLGIPMAVTTARSGKGVSVSIALAIYLVYYLFLVGGEKLADRGLLDPFLAMWMANLSLGAIGIPIFIRTIRESTLLHMTLKPHAPGSRRRRDRMS
jgi:lipopolysaccharide export system permease protein